MEKITVKHVKRNLIKTLMKEVLLLKLGIKKWY